MKPFVSVVTPSWNQGKYLSDCIRSVMGLADGLVEHIVVDNCSDDATPQVIAGHPHLVALVERDRGQSDALNKGIAMARGEWILWLNADDYLLPGTLEKYIETVQSDPRVDGVYGHMVFVDEFGEPIRTIYQPQWRFYMAKYGRYFMPSTGSLYRASLLRGSPLDIDFHMIMDTEWMLRAAEGMRPKRLRRRAVAFRVTEDNKTSANIRTGELTPRHAAEREVLNGRYPYYGPPPAGAGLVERAGLNFVRAGIRVRILADKIVSRLLDREK